MFISATKHKPASNIKSQAGFAAITVATVPKGLLGVGSRFGDGKILPSFSRVWQPASLVDAHLLLDAAKKDAHFPTAPHGLVVSGSPHGGVGNV